MPIEDLVQIMAALRSPGGCPWDLKQTSKSLAPYLLEESYEVLEAIAKGDPAGVREELGDVLFQLVFHARLAEEKGQFTMEDVIQGIREKMVRRHPHVFGEERCDTADEVVEQWAEIKKSEGKRRDSILDGIPHALPALLRAQRLQERVADIGFDWHTIRDAAKQLREELDELIAGIENDNADEIEEEMGDLLFMLVNIARFVKVSPEEALRRTNAKFISRFTYMERRAATLGKELSSMTLDEMDALWDEAKERERSGEAS